MSARDPKDSMVERVKDALRDEFAKQNIHESAGAMAFLECSPPLDVAALARAAITTIADHIDMMGAGTDEDAMANDRIVYTLRSAALAEDK